MEKDHERQELIQLKKPDSIQKRPDGLPANRMHDTHDDGGIRGGRNE
ncbi:MAG TPA: hypothetical protein PLY78_02710 [Methanospirillum sp.]|nr:hypothetical protein [Methanospirillum sp.]